MLVIRFPTMTHFRVRALEWQVTAITLLSAVLLFDPTFNTLEDRFQGMVAWGDDNFWASLMLIVGSARLFALWRNGGWVPSPWIRCATAAVSAGIWGIVCANLIVDLKSYFALAPFIVMTLSDTYSVGRAASDARLTRDDRLKQPEAPRVVSI